MMFDFSTLILDNLFALLILTIIMTFFYFFIFKNVIYSIYDPLIYPSAITIIPSFAALLFISLNLDYTGSAHKSSILIFNYFVFFLSIKLSFNNRRISGHSIQIDCPTSLQNILLISSLFVDLLNIILNGNFLESDPSLRFTSVNYVFLNYLAIAVANIPVIIICFTRDSKIINLGIKLLSSLVVLKLFYGQSKAFFFQFIFIIFLWKFSRTNELGFSLLKELVKALKSKFFMKLLLFSVLTVFLLDNLGIVSAYALLLRFFMGLDSSILFLVQDTVYLPDSSYTNKHGFDNVLQIWFKPFLKNIFDTKFDFENLSQFLTYEYSGFHATDYASTSWQPNSNFVVDTILTSEYSILFSIFFGFLFGAIIYNIKKINRIKFFNIFIFNIFTVTPFYFITDTQSFFLSLILNIFFFFSLYTFYVLLLFSTSKSRSLNA